jgi:DNA adenine methylase
MQALSAVPWINSPKPFLKWAGGKTRLLNKLEAHFPKTFGTYYEPFLGGGAVFFYLVERHPRFNAVLSDINEELITAYRVVKEDVEELIKHLKEHKKKYKSDPKKYYYFVRDTFEPSNDVEQTARLIFLNKTCFNGLYRVNKKGKFNVPLGRYKNPKICDKENLLAVNKVLQWSNAKLLVGDFQETTNDAKKGDFVYFDPPYKPVSSTANFTSYTSSGFSIKEQERLGSWFKKLDERGCKIVLSNSDTEKIWNIYDGFEIERIPTLRAINCKGNSRAGHTELIIHN